MEDRHWWVLRLSGPDGQKNPFDSAPSHHFLPNKQSTKARRLCAPAIMPHWFAIQDQKGIISETTVCFVSAGDRLPLRRQDRPTMFLAA